MPAGIGISFGGSGACFPYLLGITKYIDENYCLDNFSFVLSSGGCICAIILASRLGVDHFVEKCIIPWLIEARSPYGCFLYNDLSPRFLKILPSFVLPELKKTHIDQYNNRVTIVLTKADRTFKKRFI